MENGNYIQALTFIEHFIVWMRTAGMPNFRKTWGKIAEGLTVGNYIV